jgi:hypothetical protein
VSLVGDRLWEQRESSGQRKSLPEDPGGSGRDLVERIILAAASIG